MENPERACEWGQAQERFRGASEGLGHVALCEPVGGGGM